MKIKVTIEITQSCGPHDGCARAYSAENNVGGLTMDGSATETEVIDYAKIYAPLLLQAALDAKLSA